MENLRPVGAIINVKEEELGNYFRKVFKDAKILGSKKLYLFIITDKNFSEVVKYSREAILDNIELGIEIIIVNKENLNKIEKIILEKRIEKIIIYCSEEHRYLTRKLVDSLPNQILAMIARDYCK
ncbi:MAG: DUF5751 family protein [Sulfolobaceae archaeon]